MNAKLLGLGVLLAGLLAAGCGKTTDTPATPKADATKVTPATKQDGDEDDGGDHGPGPHGGTVIEFGKYHGEFVVDHAKKQATVYILGSDVKKPAPIAVTKLTLSVKAPQFQADLVAVPQEGDPAGKASRFVATHENFGKEQEFEGTVSGVIDGKPRAGDFKEEAHKDHDHGKKK